MTLVGREVNEIYGAGDGSRTHDLLITNQLLWPLSYPGLSDMLKEGFKNRPNLSRVSMFCYSNDGRVGSGALWGGVPGTRAYQAEPGKQVEGIAYPASTRQDARPTEEQIASSPGSSQ